MFTSYSFPWKNKSSISQLIRLDYFEINFLYNSPLTHTYISYKHTRMYAHYNVRVHKNFSLTICGRYFYGCDGVCNQNCHQSVDNVCRPMLISAYIHTYPTTYMRISQHNATSLIRNGWRWQPRCLGSLVVTA